MTTFKRVTHVVKTTTIDQGKTIETTETTVTTDGDPEGIAATEKSLERLAAIFDRLGSLLKDKKL